MFLVGKTEIKKAFQSGEFFFNIIFGGFVQIQHTELLRNDDLEPTSHMPALCLRNQNNNGTVFVC